VLYSFLLLVTKEKKKGNNVDGLWAIGNTKQICMCPSSSFKSPITKKPCQRLEPFSILASPMRHNKAYKL
jgi:hypothetical protein